MTTFETIYCPNCGKQTSTEYAFCQSCGASVTEKTLEEQPAVAPAEKNKKTKKRNMFAGIGFAFLAVLALGIFFVFGDGKVENNNALYLKDQEIFIADLKKHSEGWQLTSRLVDGEDEEDNYAEAGYVLGELMYISEDGKYIFFPDKMDGYGLNLYYSRVDKPKATAVKIDSSVASYRVNASSTIVTYLKGDEGKLYQYKLNKDSKDKIASDVRDFWVTDNGRKILYINNEGNVYLKYADKDREKIANDVSSLEYISDDLKTMYYIKDDSLYKQVEGEDKVKIASNVYRVIQIYDSGEVYYLTDDFDEVSLMDYVTDDMKIADESITEPEYPDYPSSPSWWDYNTDAEYDAAYEAYEEEYERLSTEYEAAYLAYYIKQTRDSLRESLEEDTLEYSQFSLCFFDGKEEVVITDAFVGGAYFEDYSVATAVPVISYEAYNQSSFDKVKLSEIDSVYAFEDMIEAALFSSSERYIAVKDVTTVVKQNKHANSFRMNASGTVAYYIDDIPGEERYGELYRISITDGVVGKAEVYDSNVYAYDCDFVGEEQFRYFKDYKYHKGELYMNKNKIDYDVSANDVFVDSDSDKIYYYTDWNTETEDGTLKVYDGQEAAKIADDVHDFFVTPDGRALYLCEYSLNHYMGELCEWNKGKTREIDDDVVCLIPIYKNKYRGITYSW